MADTKVSALSPITPALEDLVYLVDDPSGTPTSAQATLGDLQSLLMASGASVDNYGAVGNGSTEDTTAINDALAAESVIYFTPGKTYITDRIEVPSNVTIIGYGATLKLKAFDGAAGNYKSVLNLNAVTGVRIYGLTLDGNRTGHTNTGSLTTDEDSGMHGFRIMASTDIHLIDCTAKNCFADGIIPLSDAYEGGADLGVVSERIYVTGCTFDNNRRQGCSIICGQGFYFTDCVFSNTNGVAPEYGVDIEPDSSSQTISDVIFTRCQMIDNAEKGFGGLIPGATIENIKLIDCTITGNGDSIASVWINVNTTGTLRNFHIIGGYCDDTVRIGQSGSPGSYFENCLIHGLRLAPDAGITLQNIRTENDGWSVIIEDCHFHEATSANTIITISDAHNILIQDCSFNADTTTRAIRQGGSNTCDKITIRNCRFDAFSSQAIMNTHGDYWSILDNYFDQGSGDCFEQTEGTGTQIRGNVMVATGGPRINLGASCSGTVIGHNTFVGSGTNITDAGSGTVYIAEAGSTTVAGRVEIAVASELRAATASKVLDGASIESASAYVTLTDAATIAVDWDTFINATVTITDDRTLGLPTNGQPGTWRKIDVIQDGSGGHTLAFASGYHFVGGVAPTITADAAARDTLSIFCRTASIFEVYVAADMGAPA